MAVFAYNDEEMTKVITELGKISEGIADSVKKLYAELDKLQAEKAKAEKAYQKALQEYQKAMASYNSAMANWNGKGSKPSAPTPPSRAALNAIEAAISKAQTQITNLQKDAEVLKDVQKLMQDTQNQVRETEANVLAYINTKVLELKDFEVKKAVADAMGMGKTDSSYVKVGDKKYYTALYEDFTYKDYQAVAGLIGVPATLALMGANGMSTETGMALQGSVGNKRYDMDQVRHYMNDCTLIDKETDIDISSAAGNGGVIEMGTVSMNTDAQIPQSFDLDSLVANGHVKNVNMSNVKIRTDLTQYTVVSDSKFHTTQTVGEITEAEYNYMVAVVAHEVGASYVDESMAFAAASAIMNAFEGNVSGHSAAFMEQLYQGCLKPGNGGNGYVTDNTLGNSGVKNVTGQSTTDLSSWFDYESSTCKFDTNDAATAAQLERAKEAVDAVLNGTRLTGVDSWYGDGSTYYVRNIGITVGTYGESGVAIANG